MVEVAVFHFTGHTLIQPSYGPSCDECDNIKERSLQAKRTASP